MISSSARRLTLALFASTTIFSHAAIADDATGILLKNLPPRDGGAYGELLRIAGSPPVEALAMTRSEKWSVQRDRLDELRAAAARSGVTIMALGTDWNRALAPAEQPISDDQKAMMHDVMGQRPVVGMTTMALPPPEMLEYALTNGMASGGEARAMLTIQISKDIAVAARRTGINAIPNGYAWHGVVSTTGEPVTLLWWADGRLSGNVTYNGHVYAVRSIGGGMHGVIELAPDRLPPEHAPMSNEKKREMGMTHDPLVEQGDASKLVPRPDGSERQDARDGALPSDIEPSKITGGHMIKGERPADVVITVLAAYTPAAARYYGEIARDLIALAIEDANQSFRNSGLGHIRLELAHAYETKYRESGSHFDHLVRFSGKGDGVMDEVHALRDQYRADVAVLIVDDSMGCGLAAQVRAPEDKAFAVVDQQCAATSYSLAHEIGHLIGARHDAALDSSEQPFAFGHGYVHGREWRTMMSYKESCEGCPRLPVWSSPDVMIKGVPAGDATSDNARVIAEQAGRLAAFR